MTKTKLIQTMSLVMALSLAVFGKEYNLDDGHSSVSFKVSHMVITKVKGNFNEFSTDIKWDPKALDKSTLNATLQVASIDTDNQKRDDHLKSPDFFDAKKYPTITFKSEKIVKKGEGYEVTGKLTMKDVTKTVTIPFVAKGPIKDPWGMTRIGLSGNLVVNRKEYNVNWSKTMDNGGLVAGNDVEIEIEVEAVYK